MNTKVMKNRRNYYRILHVQPDAPVEVIRSSYRAMMQKMRLHPDLGGEGENAAIINEAYATLTNPKSRAAYDKARKSPKQRGPAAKVVAELASSSAPHQHSCAFCGLVNEGDSKDPVAGDCSRCRSPLFLSRQSLSDDDGRRAIMRLPNDQPLMLCTHWPQSEPCSGRTIDVSLNGMKFHSSAGLLADQVVKIDTRMFRAVARVTRSQRHLTGWEVGVQFISLCFERSRGSFVAAYA